MFTKKKHGIVLIFIIKIVLWQNNLQIDKIKHS